MTTSPPKVEDSRAQFEAWFHARYDQVSMPHADRGILFTKQWASWQASRAEIVLELPDYRGADTYQSAGFNEALDECDNIIRAAGITVKGDS